MTMAAPAITGRKSVASAPRRHKTDLNSSHIYTVLQAVATDSSSALKEYIDDQSTSDGLISGTPMLYKNLKFCTSVNFNCLMNLFQQCQECLTHVEYRQLLLRSGRISAACNITDTPVGDCQVVCDDRLARIIMVAKHDIERGLFALEFHHCKA